ncbi:hypothetical protein KIS1582_4081 [Cytobacillus firmus]|uniref:Uncharacterized protein n=1 Tax=Cytobacillus firmus TaxID=1399 RepID=A0A800N8V3_CYTFI|nr:hypothetical protein KIS1582_4081 [Cytobacillus firmus]
MSASFKVAIRTEKFLSAQKLWYKHRKNFIRTEIESIRT